MSARVAIRQEIRVELFVIDCATCGMLFGITKELEDRASGHGQSFSGETEAERLKRELKQARDNEKWFRDAYSDEAERRQGTERQLSATRGVVTRLHHRAVAGACPFGCRRHFADVERHVASRHAGEHLEGEA